jgi:hypothetical protein
MTTSSAPLLLARAAVELAVRPLRELDDRLRYRAEFAADLSALSAVGQLKYAAGVLTQAFALRAALGSAPTRAEEAAMTDPTRTRVPFLRCRVFRWHRWVSRSTDDGSRFPACADCGRIKDVGGPAAGGLGAMGAIGG